MVERIKSVACQSGSAQKNCGNSKLRKMLTMEACGSIIRMKQEIGYPGNNFQPNRQTCRKAATQSYRAFQMAASYRKESFLIFRTKSTKEIRLPGRYKMRGPKESLILSPDKYDRRKERRRRRGLC